MQIGYKIKSARESLNLSQSEVASRIPMNQSSYSKIERDLQEPNLEQFRRICQILSLTPEYLLSLGQYSFNSETIDLQFAESVKELYRKFYIH